LKDGIVATFTNHTNRYLVLAAILFLLVSLHAANGLWIGDFWEHSAVVRELATHPVQPQNHRLLLDAPHVLYTPYALAVALLVRLSGLPPITALALSGLVHLVLWLAALWLFCRLLLGRGAAFYTLLFTLLLWGRSAWAFSGFFHLGTLGYVLSYPSMLATGLSLLALACFSHSRHRKSYRWLLPLYLFAPLVLLIHGLTFIFLVVGLLAFSIAYWPLARRDYLLLLGLFAFCGLAALAWPYYSFLDFLRSESAVYHIDNLPVYQGVIGRIWPALAGLIPLAIRLRRNWRDPLGLLFAGLVVVYLAGGLLENWSYGRIMPFVVLALHLALAWAIVSFEKNGVRLFSGFTLRGRAVFFVTLSAVVLLSFNNMIRPALSRARPGQESSYQAYLFLGDYTGQYEIVLTDLGHSWFVPTFGGKVIASLKALPFVPDNEARREDLRRFFDPQTTAAARQAVIERYQADYVLISHAYLEESPQTIAALLAMGTVVFENEDFSLVALPP
jgi:alpha-1,6-mannosyltransferase